LREIALHVAVSGQSLPAVSIPDLLPGEHGDIDLALPRVHAGSALAIEGRLAFVTHFGFRSSVPVRLIAR
jgi:hypothetical protein